MQTRFRYESNKIESKLIMKKTTDTERTPIQFRDPTGIIRGKALKIHILLGGTEESFKKKGAIQKAADAGFTIAINAINSGKFDIKELIDL